MKEALEGNPRNQILSNVFYQKKDRKLYKQNPDAVYLHVRMHIFIGANPIALRDLDNELGLRL
jgi:hypothetical protein